MAVYLDDIRISAASIGVILKQIGVPQERFATPPWMSRRFADSLIACQSFEDVAALIARDTRDTAAFLTTVFHVIKDMESDEWVLDRPPEATEITAAGHAVISFLDEVEHIYPEGLTKYGRDAI